MLQACKDHDCTSQLCVLCAACWRCGRTGPVIFAAAVAEDVALPLLGLTCMLAGLAFVGTEAAIFCPPILPYARTVRLTTDPAGCRMSFETRPGV